MYNVRNLFHMYHYKQNYKVHYRFTMFCLIIKFHYLPAIKRLTRLVLIQQTAAMADNANTVELLKPLLQLEILLSNVCLIQGTKNLGAIV